MDEYKSRLSAYLSDMVREELEKYDGGFTDEWNDQRKKNAEVLGYKLSGKSDIKEGWWEDLSDKAQAAYIKKHGEAPNSSGKKEDDIESKITKSISKGKKGEEKMKKLNRQWDKTTSKASDIAKEMGGNMTGAVKKIEKIKKGLSDDPKVKAALRSANESINEKISKEEWARYPAYARKLKPYLQKLFKVPLKVRVIKQANENPFIDIRVARFGKDIIPNDFRVKAAKTIGASSVRDWDNVNYGNIRVNSISLKYDQWVKLLGNKIKESVNEGTFGKFDTGAAFKGNGLTIYDRNQSQGSDYKNIAHIGEDGKVTIYDKNVKKESKLMQSIKKISQEFKTTFKESVNEGKLTEAKFKDIDVKKLGKKKTNDLMIYLFNIVDLGLMTDMKTDTKKKILSVNISKISPKVAQNIQKRFGVDLKESVNEAKRYKLGDSWSKDFDYTGMLKYGKSVDIRDDEDKLLALHHSLEDVNYHNVAKPLWDAMVALKTDKKSKALSLMKKVNKLSKNGLDEGIIVEFLNERKLSSRQKKAILIAIEMSGNMTGATEKIEKIKRGLSKDKKVVDALRLANESINEARGISIGEEGMYFFIDQLINSMEHYDEREFVRELGMKLEIDKKVMGRIWKNYDKVHPSLKSKWTPRHWERWLNKQGITEDTKRDYKSEFNKYFKNNTFEESVTEDRNYRLEYDNYHKQPVQRERNAARKRARRQMEKEGKVKKFDGMDVHHKDNNPLNNEKGNLSVTTQKYNRSEPRRRGLKKEDIREDVGIETYLGGILKSMKKAGLKLKSAQVMKHGWSKSKDKIGFFIDVLDGKREKYTLQLEVDRDGNLWYLSSQSPIKLGKWTDTSKVVRSLKTLSKLPDLGQSTLKRR